MSKIRMKFFLSGFAREEDGAVTVDWVVLTAAIIGLGLAVLGAVSSGTLALGGAISQAVADTEVASWSSSGGAKGGGSPVTAPPTTTVVTPPLPPALPPVKSP